MSKVITHEIGPVWRQDSRVLILGTIPSPMSRETGFFYGHPQNRFWRVLAQVFEVQVPGSITEKTQFLREYHIALWDVLHSCKITGASDSSIKDPVANDFSEIIENAQVKAIFTTGRKATELYGKLCARQTGIDAQYLPSTSPANCAVSFEQLVTAYGAVREAVLGIKP